ncbi:MAG: phosphatase PAP2 family protein [Desulfobacteraceae bacterium]|nr:MAG: phosphatase PAP2 family protein [Desulfobacteraceae bacterium]
MDNVFKRGGGPILKSTVFIVLITVIAVLFDLDYWIAKAFYVPGKGFPLEDAFLVRCIYESITVTAVLCCLFFIRFAYMAIKEMEAPKHSRLVMALFVSMLLGPLLIVNIVFKDHLGRPRPVHNIMFGGLYEPWSLVDARWGAFGNAFPSGHAAVPVSFLLLVFAAHRRGKRLLAAGLAAAILVWYLAVCYARIAAGRHFFTDVLWSAYFAFVCAWLSYLVIERRGKVHTN